MPGLIIDGHELQIPRRKVLNFRDDSRYKLDISAKWNKERDGRPRNNRYRVRIIMVHTSKGIPGGKNRTPQSIIEDPYCGNIDFGKKSIDVWSVPGRQAGAAVSIGPRGDVYCLCDVVRDTTYHCAGSIYNDVSVGIECYQDSKGRIYRATLEALVDVADVLTGVLGIPRQIPDKYRGPHSYLAKGKSRARPPYYGVVGHRDVSRNRGFGDPGDFAMNVLAEAGYDGFDLTKGADAKAWREHQKDLKVVVDGQPGRGTMGALRDLVGDLGQHVPRPLDSHYARWLDKVGGIRGYW